MQFLLWVPRHRLRTTKEIVQPNIKAPRRTLLFGSFVSFVMKAPTERPHYFLQEREKPKFVRCMIRSMHSRLVFVLSGVFTPDESRGRREIYMCLAALFAIRE